MNELQIGFLLGVFVGAWLMFMAGYILWLKAEGGAAR